MAGLRRCRAGVDRLAVAYLSPGITVQALPKLHLFAFAQLPVYKNLYGYQLFLRWTGSVGVSYAF
jgi:hypothetical protein